MALGSWGGMWGGNGSPWAGFYGRIGPDYSQYYTQPAPPGPPEPALGGGSGSSGKKPSLAGQQAPVEQWNNPGLVQRYFGNADPKDYLFWQTKEGMPFAYQRYVSQEAAPDSYYNKWLQNQEGWMTQGFVDQSRHNPDLAYPDYIASKSQELAQRYAALPTWQQGMNPGSWFAGRRL